MPIDDRGTITEVEGPCATERGAGGPYRRSPSGFTLETWLNRPSG